MKKHKKKLKKGAKSKGKKEKLANLSPAKPHPEAIGFALFVLSLALFISLFSFVAKPGSTNSLGLVGHTIGSSMHIAFGLSCYLFALFAGWVGWRLLFSNSVNRLGKKVGCLLAMAVSLSMLLSLFEDRYPSIGRYLGELFHTLEWQGERRYHLGGAPFFYLYRDLPHYNLYRIFNSFGVAFFFSGTLLTSLMLLCKAQPKKLLERVLQIVRLFSSLSPNSNKKFADYIASVETTKKALRFVKLRTGAVPEEQGRRAKRVQEDLLAIEPETNLTVRPSVSRKQEDQSFPFDFPGSRRRIAKASQGEKKVEEVKKEGASAPPLKAVKKVAEREVMRANSKRSRALQAQAVYNGDFTNFILPGSALLTSSEKVDQTALKQNLKRQAEVLEETLSSFGIEAKVGQINCGPTINSFEVHPSIGVKVQKIKALESDIALNMEAKSIRIIAPIPGKAAVGIEIPNPHPQEVSFKDMLRVYQQGSKKFQIPILLGKAVNGDYVMSDLAKMPHCIIAGATGSGKSVCINTIVMSILMNAKPDEIKMIMVDPKKVELTPYTKLPHMLAPVITEPQGACAALMWLVKEMESRYELLKLLGVRNIASFNNRKIDKAAEEALGREVPEKLQYIVGIIDELADLMMVASSDIETPIARIAQMARAVGIHLILATQRPSREVITGIIKANFPTRIAFKVASRVNSQIILDETGAETLLGNGDMLFLPPGTSHIMRAQGAFIRDEDINSVVAAICEQAPPNYVIESFDAMGDLGDFGSDEGEEEAPKDRLYQSAVDLVLSAGNASTTFLQRKLKVGYARAASLMDELEERGVIASSDGGKARKVLIAGEGGEEEKPEGELLLSTSQIKNFVEREGSDSETSL